MPDTLWIQDNATHYVNISPNSKVDVAVDFISRLQTGEKLTTAVHTVTSGSVTVHNQYVYADQSLYGTQSHQAVGWLEPLSSGIHQIKLTATTDSNRIFCYSYQIRSE